MRFHSHPFHPTSAQSIVSFAIGIPALPSPNGIVPPSPSRVPARKDPPMSVRIEIRSAHAASQSSPGQAIVRSAAALGISTLRDCHIVRLYFLAHDPGEDALQHLCAFLLADPVLEQAKWGAIDQAPARSSSPVIEVAYRPGVTDVAARELARGMVEIGLPACEVATGTRYELTGDLVRRRPAPPGPRPALQHDRPALQPWPHRRPLRPGCRRRRPRGDRTPGRPGL